MSRPKLSFNIGRPESCEARPPDRPVLRAKERFQNVFLVEGQEKGQLSYRRYPRAEDGYWLPACPGTGGGKDWQAMSYDRARPRWSFRSRKSAWR